MYKPDILTGVGIAGVFITAYLSAKAAIKYQKETEDKKLSTKEKVVTGAKCFSGVALAATGTAIAIYKSNELSKTYLAGAVGLYEATSRRLYNQTEAIKETVSEEVQKDIQDKTDAKDLSNSSIVIEDTGTGNFVFYDQLVHRYYRMSMENFLHGRYEFNRTNQLRGQVNLNYLYRLWNVKESILGETIGWNEYYLSNEWDAYWIDIDAREITTESGGKMWIISYPIPPKWDYESD